MNEEKAGMSTAVSKAIEMTFKKKNAPAQSNGPSIGQDVQDQLAQMIAAQSGQVPSMQQMKQIAGMVNQQSQTTGSLAVQPPQTGMAHGEIRVVSGTYVPQDIEAVLNKVISMLSNNEVIDTLDDEGFDSTMVEEAVSFLQSFTVSSADPLSDEETLILEMGKLYRERYDMAQDADNQKQMDRAWGAMAALKKVQEMLKREI